MVVLVLEDYPMPQEVPQEDMVLGAAAAVQYKMPQTLAVAVALEVTQKN